MKKKLFQKQLDNMIEGATTDCYGEDECRTGFFTMIEDNIKFPFEATVVGEKVEVIGVDFKNDGINAICKCNGKKYFCNILEIEYQQEKVAGWQWIEAFRQWSVGL